MRKKWINVFLFCLLLLDGRAQTAGFRFYCKIDSIKASGFYNIELTPDMAACLKTDYSDLRIVNDSGKWVPHVLHCPALEKNFDAISRELKFTRTISGAVTILIIESPETIISNLALTIRNTQAERYCTLSGSDDQKNWFVINDSILIKPDADANSTQNTFLISFPPCNYRVFKLSIINNNKDPFDISKVETNSSAPVRHHAENKLLPNPVTLLEQKDSGKTSYIKVTQQKQYHFEYLNIGVRGVRYFYRQLDVYIPASATHSYDHPGRLVQSFTISNNSTLQFNLPLSNARIFYLAIRNEDNLPLTVTEVKTSYNYLFLNTYLEKGSGYKLISGNLTATAPNYDLARLTAPDAGNIPFLSTGPIAAVQEISPDIMELKKNKWILWACLALVLLILLFFTSKMLNEVKKIKQDDRL
jgi:hypothetical protein